MFRIGKPIAFLLSISIAIAVIGASPSHAKPPRGKPTQSSSSTQAAKTPGKTRRAINKIKKVMGFKPKNPTAAKQSYTAVRPRRASTAGTPGVSKRVVQAGGGQVVHNHFHVRNNIVINNVPANVRAGVPLKPASQIPSSSPAGRQIRAIQQNNQLRQQLVYQQKQQVQQKAMARNPNAQPRQQGRVQGQPMRPLPVRPPAGSQPPQKPNSLAVGKPGFGIVNGRKVSRPEVQGTVPTNRRYDAVPPAPKSRYGVVPPKPRNQYESISQPLAF